MTNDEIVKVSFDCPKSLIAAVDEQAKLEERDRAKFIRRALQLALAQVAQPTPSPISAPSAQ